MANFKNITDLPIAESAEGINLIVNDNGSAKQIAASAVGGGDEYDYLLSLNLANGITPEDVEKDNFEIIKGNSQDVIAKLQNNKPVKVAVIFARDTGSATIYATYVPETISYVSDTLRMSFPFYPDEMDRVIVKAHIRLMIRDNIVGKMIIQ